MAEDAASWYQRKLAAVRGPAPARPFQYQQPQQTYNPAQAQVQVNHNHQPPGTLSELLQLQENGQGLAPGKGARLNPDPCPNCGGKMFYANLGLKRRGPPPAPHCFTCGYNDLFEQGVEANWQGGA
jgi:hypothetical protein